MSAADAAPDEQPKGVETQMQGLGLVTARVTEVLGERIEAQQIAYGELTIAVTPESIFDVVKSVV